MWLKCSIGILEKFIFIVYLSSLATNIDECAKFPGQLCAHKCVNTDVSYRCECNEGFRLRADGRTCQQISKFPCTMLC